MEFKMDDFLTVPPVLTPLIAGATTTTITGTLASPFYLPDDWGAVIACLIWSLSVMMRINAAGMAATKNHNPAQQPLSPTPCRLKKRPKPPSSLSSMNGFKCTESRNNSLTLEPNHGYTA